MASKREEVKPEVFKSAQAQRVIKYVRETYGGELEFLWQKFSRNAIWRNQENKKWYGALLVVPASRLGLKSDEEIDIIDLRFFKNEALDFAASKDNAYPGWHMNKNNWVTVILDDSMTDAELFGLIDQSYEIAKKKGKK